MECMSTMRVKLEHPERQKVLLPGAPNVKIVLRYFHRPCYKSIPAVIPCWRGLRSQGLAMDEHGKYLDLRGLGHRSIIPYVHRRMGVILLKR
jgi:hypothetical protein